MDTIKLGSTGLTVSRTGFGCLPMQRVSFDEAKELLLYAFEHGVTFFDTARGYTDSEAKLGYAFSGMREKIVIATKSGAKTGAALEADLETSLKELGTDYIDVYQFHNTPFVPMPGGADGLYDAALRAKAAGKIRHIGITSHSLARATQAVESGLFETLQFPFNHLSTAGEIALVKLCREKNVGFICMKGMSGGLVTNARIPFAYIRQFENAVPIWGIQRMREIEEFIAYSENPPMLTDALLAEIEKDRKELSGAFCRGCGYCLPCPVGIPIQMANRMRELLARSPSDNWLSPMWREGMEKIEDCTKCGACEKKCPYGLKPFETLPTQLAAYRAFIAQADASWSHT